MANDLRVCWFERILECWADPEPFPIGFVGLCDGWGATGSWEIEDPPSAPTAAAQLFSPPPHYPSSAPVRGSLMWVDATSGQVPPGAVVGGQDCSGEPLYVARARHNGATLPGKLVSSHGCAFVPWDGQEHRKPEYQVLVGGPANWVSASGSNIPPGAFPGGESENGETLFIGRVNHDGSITTGKIHKSHGVCYISFAGLELGFPDYEILMP